MYPDIQAPRILLKARQLSSNWELGAYSVISDESERKGLSYSYFFGGLLIPNASIHECRSLLDEVALNCGVVGEIKWTKTCSYNVEGYMQMATAFLMLVAEGACRLRVAYSSNTHLHAASKKRAKSEALYLKLYHNFLLHGFSLTRANLPPKSKNLFFMMDRLPVGSADGETFATTLSKIPNQWSLRKCKVPDSPFVVQQGNISEIESLSCLLLQMVDLVTGAMYSLANEQPGAVVISKRGGAKKSLKLHIIMLLKQLTRCPGLNVHETSGMSGSWFEVPYRHWIVESRL